MPIRGNGQRHRHIGNNYPYPPCLLAILTTLQVTGLLGGCRYNLNKPKKIRLNLNFRFKS
uniref:Uncharacterized protein n=1 Tax=Arundo donax TaxID=35708 RepID=A0A0A9C1F8_ARUDO